MMLALLLILSITILVTELPREQEQSASLVAVGQLHAGETVRVYGQISSTSATPLMAHWVSAGGAGGYWTWSTQSFYLVQGGSRIWVQTQGLGNNIYGAPDGAQGSLEYYPNGSSICVYGTVQTSGGNLTLAAQAAAASPTGFSEAFALYGGYASAAGAAVMGVLAVILYRRGLQRLRRHLQRPRQPGMYDYVPHP